MAYLRDYSAVNPVDLSSGNDHVLIRAGSKPL
jgi:hypothetical protein